MPTANRKLPIRIGGFDTATDALDYAAQGETGSNFYDARGRLKYRQSYAELRDSALKIARRLVGLGLARGARVGLMAETHPDFLAFYFGCQYAGMLPVPLPVNAGLGGQDVFAEQLGRLLTVSEAEVAIGVGALPKELVAAAACLGLRHVYASEAFFELPASQATFEPLGADEVSHLQFSSGSTRHPVGVVITQSSLKSNATMIARHGLAIRAGDRASSWLPFYHDMGLIGFVLTPIMCQLTTDYISPDAFARRPLVWLSIMSRNGGTIGFSPTFGYELCAKRAPMVNAGELDLRRWRIAGIGGEMIRAETMRKFAEHFGAFGFDEAAFVPSYGMAEATLAISFAPLARGVRCDTVDGGGLANHHAQAVRVNGAVARGAGARGVGAHGAGAHGAMPSPHGGANGHGRANGRALAGNHVNGSAVAGNHVNGSHMNGSGVNGSRMNGIGAHLNGTNRDDGWRAGAREFVRCGQILPGHLVEIRDEDDTVLPERRIGRIFFKGPSLMGGYYNDDAATAAVLDAAGWLDTGDMGYMVDGELVVTGRRKDLLIVNGRNIWPQDLEWAAEQAPGIRSRDTAAFSIEEDDREVAVVLVQCRLGEGEARERLCKTVQASVHRHAGIECRVALVPPRSLPFTTSGKLSRSRARELYLAGAMAGAMAGGMDNAPVLDMPGAADTSIGNGVRAGPA